MKAILDIIADIFISNGFVMAFLIVGIVAMFSNFVSTKITKGRIHNSAIAIFLGLVLAYIGGIIATKYGVSNGWIKDVSAAKKVLQIYLYLQESVFLAVHPFVTLP